MHRHQDKTVGELKRLLENIDILVPIEAAAIQNLVRAACTGAPAAIVMAIQGRILDPATIGPAGRPQISKPKMPKAEKPPEPPKPEKGKATEIDRSLPDPTELAAGDGE